MGEWLISWRELLIAVVLATGIYLLEVVLFSRRRRKARKPDALRDLDLDLDALFARMTELERQMWALRDQMHELRTASDKAALEQRQAEQQATPYAQAVQLARQGISPQELAHRCGITNGEAELIVALNRAEP